MKSLLRIPTLSILEKYFDKEVEVDKNRHPAEFCWINPKHIVCVEPIELYRLTKPFQASAELISYSQKKYGDSNGHISHDDIPSLDTSVLYHRNSFYHYWVKDCVKLTLINDKVVHSPMLYKDFDTLWHQAGFNIIESDFHSR